MAESSSVTEHTQALTLQGSCPAADEGEYLNGVTTPDKMADGEFLQGVTKEMRNGDVYKHKAAGGFVSNFDKKADDEFHPTDDQKPPSAFCDEDILLGDVPSNPVPREPEIPLEIDATSFPQQCEDYVGSNINDSFSPFNSEISSYSQTGSHESLPAIEGEQEMDPTPEALPDPVPPMGQGHELIDFSKDNGQAADVGNVDPFIDTAPGEVHPSDPGYSGFGPYDGNNKNTEQNIQSPLRHDAPEFFPQGHSNADFSPLRHDAPEFLLREPQQAAMYDQSPHSGGVDGSEIPSLSQSDTFDKPKEQAQDVIDRFAQCKENVPVSMEEQSVPAINIMPDQGEDDEAGEEDYSESESNSQVENDEIIEDDYTDSEDTENIQDSDDVPGRPALGEGAVRHVVFDDGVVHSDQGSVKPAFSENDFQFQQQDGELMPSVGAEPLVIGGCTEQGPREQANEMGSSQMDIVEDSVVHQQVGTSDLQRDTICKSETFTIESDSEMEERSITPEQEGMRTARVVAGSNQPLSGLGDSLETARANSGTSPPFTLSQMDLSFNQEEIDPPFNQGQIEPVLNQGKMEPPMNQRQEEQNIFASDFETGPARLMGDDDMLIKQPVFQQEPENKQQVVIQDELNFPQQSDFQNDIMPSEGFTQESIFPEQDISPLELSPKNRSEQPDWRDDVVTPREILLEETSEQRFQMGESGVEHGRADMSLCEREPASQAASQLEDVDFSQVFSQKVDHSFMDNENKQTRTEALVEPNRQLPPDLVTDQQFEPHNQGYEDEEGYTDEDGDKYMYQDDQYSEEEEQEEEEEEEGERYVSPQPQQQDAQQLTSDDYTRFISEEQSISTQEQMLTSEEMSVSPQDKQFTSEEKSVSPEERDMNEYKESHISEKRSVSPEVQDNFTSEDRYINPPEPSNDQKMSEEQITPQSFEKESFPFEHDMVQGEKEQLAIGESFGMAPVLVEVSELERVSSPDQPHSPATVDTDGDAHASGRDSEDSSDEQGEDSLTDEGGNDSDQGLPEHLYEEDVTVQPNITNDQYQFVPRETILTEINEEGERLEAGGDMKESGMGESIITADSQDDQSPSKVPRQMMENDGDMERSLTESMERPTYEDDTGVSPAQMTTSLMKGSMVLKKGKKNNVHTESALEEYSKDRMEDDEIENRQEPSSETAEVEEYAESPHLAPQLMVTEAINVREDVEVVQTANTEDVSPVDEVAVPPAVEEQVVEPKSPKAVPEASTTEKGTEKTIEKQDELPEFGDTIEPTKKAVKKIPESAEKKPKVIEEKPERNEAKPRKQEKPITKTPQKPMRKPKERTPPKTDASKIPSPTKREGCTTKSTTRTVRSSAFPKTMPPRTLNTKQSTEKPPFDTSFPRTASASRQRIIPLSQTPTTPSPTKAPTKNLPTRTQSKEATQSFLERMSRPRCRTPKKDGSPNSGMEEDKNQRAASATSQRKKYGIDAKNDNYKPGGGNVKITDQKVMVKHVGSKIDARAKTPTGSPRKDTTPKSKPTTPKGPTPDTKHVQSKIGSLKNTTHTPGGGNIKIPTQKTDYSTVQGKIGSKANLDHQPKGGDKKIETAKLDFNEKATSRVGSKDNIDHKAGGGEKKIETKKLDFKDRASPKIGSKDNASHRPGGGDKKIECHKLTFKESAKPRTDTGTGPAASTPPSKSPSLQSSRPDSGIFQDRLPLKQEVTSPGNMADS